MSRSVQWLHAMKVFLLVVVVLVLSTQVLADTYEDKTRAYMEAYTQYLRARMENDPNAEVKLKVYNRAYRSYLRFLQSGKGEKALEEQKPQVEKSRDEVPKREQKNLPGETTEKPGMQESVGNNPSEPLQKKQSLGKDSVADKPTVAKNNAPDSPPSTEGKPKSGLAPKPDVFQGNKPEIDAVDEPRRSPAPEGAVIERPEPVMEKSFNEKIPGVIYEPPIQTPAIRAKGSVSGGPPSQTPTIRARGSVSGGPPSQTSSKRSLGRSGPETDDVDPAVITPE